MSSVTQVAFQLDDRSLAAIDALAAEGGHSRAEVLRMAVRVLLARRREDEIDAQLAAGYAQQPQSPIEDRLADLSVEGLAAASLDW
ncbi:MAG: ribbon-helix-helix protein, CopG family [Pseudonocardiales bacterium]|nr:ribbon-helix-helix protein, CopG family [Pseudonocardiales bacterium]